jgi:hypothetical protein
MGGQANDRIERVARVAMGFAELCPGRGRYQRLPCVSGVPRQPP